MSDSKLPRVPSLVGKQVGPWILRKRLGEGGMSVVYWGQHTWLPQQGAVKILRPELRLDPKLIERFWREARAASQLNHDNIIHVQDFGHHDDYGYYMVLEYLQGCDLESFIDDAPFPTDWNLALIKQICDGLEATHTAGIIHRDLKPSNIFLLQDTPYPKVKVLDFGIAKQLNQEKKLTQTGSILGTPAYLSPEQLNQRADEPITPSVDLYALGVIIYQLFTGQLPIDGTTFIEHIIAVAQKPPPLLGTLRPELEGTKLEALLAQLLAKHPKERPASARDLWHELQRATADFEDPLTGSPTPVIPAPKPIKTRPTPPQEQPTEDHPSFSREAPVPVVDLSAYTPTELSAYKPIKAQLPEGQETKSVTHHEAKDQNAGQDTQEIPWSAFGTQQHTSVFQKPRASAWPQRFWLGFLLLGISLTLWSVLSSTKTDPPKPPTKRPVRPPTKQPVRPPPKTASPRPRVPDKAPPRRLAFLEKLAIEGTKAFQQGNNARAVALWKRATRQKEWRQSRSYPRLYKAIGIALARQNLHYSALMYYQRYLNSKQASPKEAAQLRATIPKLKALWKRQLRQANRLARKLPHKLKSSRWRTALRDVRTIQKLVPSTPSVHEKIARNLANTLPRKALSIYKDTLNMELSPPMRARIRRQIRILRMRIAKQKQTLAKALAQARNAIKHDAFWKQRSSFLPKLQNNPIAFFSLPQSRSMLRWALQHQITDAGWLAKHYLPTFQKLHRSGKTDWLSTTQRGRLPARRQFLQRLHTVNAIAAAHEGLFSLRDDFRQGRLSQAAGTLERFKQHLTKAQTLDRWKYVPTAFHKLLPFSNWLPLLSALLKSQGRLFTLFQNGRLKTFTAHYRKVSRTLDKTRVQLAIPLKAKTLQRWKHWLTTLNQHKRNALRSRKLGQQAFAQRQWKKARQHYLAYLTIVPKAKDRKKIQRKIHICNCRTKGKTNCP